MTELSEMQAVLIADAHREPEYRMGQVPPPKEWPEGHRTLASVVDGETWTALNSAYMMAEYIFVSEEGELPMRALYGRAWLPHEISAAIHRAQSRLLAYADLPSGYEPRSRSIRTPNGVASCSGAHRPRAASSSTY